MPLGECCGGTSVPGRLAIRDAEQATSNRKDGALRRLLRAYVEHDVLRYAVSAGVVLLIMLLVPDLLNNMILTLAVLLLGVSFIPEILRRRL